MSTEDRKSRTGLPDIVGQALLAAFGRRVRSALTVAGVALGVAMAVATVGISGSAADAVSERFDELTATQVSVRFPTSVALPTPDDSARARRLNGVTEAGLLCAGSGARQVGTNRISALGASLTAHAAEPEALVALGAKLTAGRWFDDGHVRRGDAVAVVDTAAAQALGITDLSGGLMVFLDGRPRLVVGVYQAPPGEARLTRAIVVPYSECTASVRPSWLTGAEAVLRTRIGSADQVGSEAPFALYPRDPQALVVAVPPELRTFRKGVERQTQALFLGLAAVSLLIGAIGIGNTTYVAVLERRGEIGLRRAVGASRSAVGAQFLVESGLSGILGGIVGVILGVNITAVTCLLKDWTVVFSPWLLAIGPLLGLVVGMLAGLSPAIAAARLAPVDALRG